MPYLIRPSWRGWTVRKKYSGRLVGRTDSYAKALALVKAIYANEGKHK
jgi:hypothetical protein